MPDKTLFARPSLASLRDTVGALLRRSALRGQAMLVVLLLVWIGFHILTSGLFLSPRNLSALAIQGSIKGVLAVGMTMLLIAGEIDLSLGATVALTGIVAALLQVGGYGVASTLGLSVATGLALGVVQGSLIAFAAIPAFIITLAGMLAWRGIGFVLTGSASVGPVSDSFSALAGSYIPIVPSAVILAVVAACILLWGWLSKAIATAFLSLIAVGVIAWAMLSYRGLPTAVGIMAVCAGLGAFVLNQTVFGRRLYIVGGNPEAALYAGISRRGLRFILFVLMGALYGLGGAMMTARLGGAPPNVGIGLELDVISACIIGGVSLFGGRGGIRGAMIGVFLFESLTNGMALLNLNINFQLVVRGLVLVCAVWLDVLSQKRGALKS